MILFIMYLWRQLAPVQPHSHITRGWRQYGDERERANARLAFITPCYTCPSRQTMACRTWANQKGANLQIRTSWDRTIHHTFHVTRQHMYLFLFNSLYLNVAYLHGYTITKIEPEVQNTLVKIPIVLGLHWLDFQGQIELKVKIYPILGLWVCPDHKSIPNEVRLSKFGPKMHLSTVKFLIDFGIDWLWFSVSFLTSNLLYSTKFCVSYSLPSFCIYLVRPWPVSVPHPTWLRTYTDSYACGQGPAIDHETV